jgi:hypothetical protein
MKVLGNLTVDKDNNVKYPLGANIQNETDTVNGTPVIREIYGDVLMNLYRILELTNTVPTNTEDNKDTQFQLVEALKKLPNSMNDIEQVLTLSGSVWSVNFDLSILPNKYFFLARASNDYVSGGTYTFKGSGVTELPFTSDGFNASDEILVVIDTSGVRAYSLNKLNSTPDFLPLLLNGPIRYSSGSDLYYFDNGKLYRNLQFWDLENSIRVDQSDGALILKTCGFMQGYVVCVVFNPGTLNYEFYAFNLTDLTTVILLTLAEVVQTPTVDFEPEFYIDNNYVFCTNNCNTIINDYTMFKLNFNVNDLSLNVVETINLDSSFSKTENGTIKGGQLHTLVSNELNVFNVNTGVKTPIGYYPFSSGYLFFLKDSLYVGTGNIAHKLNL